MSRTFYQYVGHLDYDSGKLHADKNLKRSIARELLWTKVGSGCNKKCHFAYKPCQVNNIMNIFLFSDKFAIEKCKNKNFVKMLVFSSTPRVLSASKDYHSSMIQVGCPIDYVKYQQANCYLEFVVSRDNGHTPTLQAFEVLGFVFFGGWLNNFKRLDKSQCIYQLSNMW